MLRHSILSFALTAAFTSAIATTPTQLPGESGLHSIIKAAGITKTTSIQTLASDCSLVNPSSINNMTVLSANVHHLGDQTYSWRYLQMKDNGVCAWLDSPQQRLLSQMEMDLLETASATVMAQRDKKSELATNGADTPAPALVAQSSLLAFGNSGCHSNAGGLSTATAISPNIAITAGVLINSPSSSCIFHGGRRHHVLTNFRTAFSGVNARPSIGLVQFQNALTLTSYPRLEYKTYTTAFYPNTLYEFFSAASSTQFSSHGGYIPTNIPQECAPGLGSPVPGLLTFENPNTDYAPNYGGSITYGGDSVVRGIYTHHYRCSSPGGGGYPAFSRTFWGGAFLNEREHYAAVQQYLALAAPTQSVTVSSPALAANLFSNQPVVLQADVAGAPANAQIIWSSDQQGTLGTGNPLTVTLTKPGPHLLTARLSTDSRFADTTTVYVEIVPTVSLSASPDLLQLAPNTTGSTTISWSSGRNQLQKLNMYVSRDGAPFVQFENNIAGSTGSSTINWIAGGSQYVFIARGRAVGSTIEREFARMTVRTEAPPCDGAMPQTDGWYIDSAKVGTAVQIARRGSDLVFGWLTYTSGGTPVWYFGQPTRDACGIYQGSIREYSRLPSGSTTSVVVAQVKLRFTDSKTAQFTYKFGTEERTVTLNSFEFGQGAGPNMTGFYADASRPNSGSYVISQGGTHVAAVYLYSNSGVATWAFGSKTSQIDGQINNIAMVKYRGTGRCPLCSGPQSELTPEDLGGLTIHRAGSGASFNGNLLGVGINWPFAWTPMGAL